MSVTRTIRRRIFRSMTTNVEKANHAMDMVEQLFKLVNMHSRMLEAQGQALDQILAAIPEEEPKTEGGILIPHPTNRDEMRRTRGKVGR